MRLQIRKPLPDPLMWPRLIVVHNIGFEETVELFLLQDQEMIQAFSPDASKKSVRRRHLLVASGTAFEAL
jgi:hypothetical protein